MVFIAVASGPSTQVGHPGQRAACARSAAVAATTPLGGHENLADDVVRRVEQRDVNGVVRDLLPDRPDRRDPGPHLPRRAQDQGQQHRDHHEDDRSR